MLLFPSPSFLISLPQTGQKLNCFSFENLVLHIAKMIWAKFPLISVVAVAKSNFSQNSHTAFHLPFSAYLSTLIYCSTFLIIFILSRTLNQDKCKNTYNCADPKTRNKTNYIHYSLTSAFSFNHSFIISLSVKQYEALPQSLQAVASASVFSKASLFFL